MPEPNTPRLKTDQDFVDAHFMNYFKHMQKSVEETATKTGWHETERPETEYVANIHREISELFDAIAKDDPPDKHCPEFNSSEIEMADVIIRLMDWAAQDGYRLAEAIVAKARYNQTRSYRHGGKKF